VLAERSKAPGAWRVAVSARRSGAAFRLAAKE